MQEVNFIIREPLLDAQEGVLGYELTVQQCADQSGKLSSGEANALVQCVAGYLAETGSASLSGGHLQFLHMPSGLLHVEALSQLPAGEIVLSIRGSDLAQADTPAAIGTLREQGYGISLRDADLAVVDKSLLAEFTHFEASMQADDFATQLELHRALELPHLRMVVRDVANWQQFDFCAPLGVDVHAGALHLTPREGKRAKGLNQAQTMILQLMDMVKRGVNVKELEAVLKRDPAVSFKLLHYINSAGFGLGCEIESLRHAVTLLGYSPLYRWLGLLLATSTTGGYSPVVMQTAIVRGRFTELLGRTFLAKNEAENLFMIGMFSLLDRLLGVSIEEVVEKIQLSDAVSEALLSREGIYGPFLTLAEACELKTADVQAIAGALCISAEQVNHAHLSAISWAHNIKL